MSSTSQALKRLGVGTVTVATVLAMPYVGVFSANAATGPAKVTIDSQAGGFGSTRSDGANSTVKISTLVTPPGTGGGAAVASVRFSYKSGTAAPVIIGTDTAAPYSIEWTPPAPGTFTEIAEGLDASGIVIGGPTSPATSTLPVTIGDFSSVHVSSPVDGGSIGLSPSGSIIVTGTRSADLPGLSITATTVDNTDTAGAATGTANTTVTAGTGTTAFSVAVATPACPSGVASCDVVIKAIATGSGTNGASDEVVEASLYNQVLTNYVVAPATAQQPVNSAQSYTVTATDQNGKPVVGTLAKVTSDKPSTDTITPVSGTTDTTGTFTFTVADSAPETSTITATSGSNPATDFTRTATLVTYSPTVAALAISATPSKAEYATNGMGANDDEYTATTPKVTVCVKDQFGSASSQGVNPPNLIITQQRTSTTSGVTTTGAATQVTPLVADTATGCYLITKADSGSADSGVDTFNAYYESNGTPGFQSGEVAAAPLVLKFAKLSINGKNTQAVKNTSVTVSLAVTGADGSVFANRKVALSAVNGTFPTTQPSGTTFIDAQNATGVTDANGIVQATVTKTTAGNATVSAADTVPATGNQIPTNVTSGELSATVSFRDLSIAVTQLTKYGSAVLQPSANNSPGNFRPGDVSQATYQLTDANGLPLDNVTTTLSTDNGFFTPLCPDSYVTCTFTPVAADGAVTGNLKNLGKTITVTSDNGGFVTFSLSDARDAQLDINGTVPVVVTATATGGTAKTSGENSVRSITTDSITVANGGSVKLLPGSAPNALSGDVQGTGSYALLGQSASNKENFFPNGTGSNFAVHVTDQFGNLVRLDGEASSCLVKLEVTGGGYLNGGGTTRFACGSFTSNEQSYNVDSDSTSTTGQSNTVTATWPAPVTLFKVTPATPTTMASTTTVAGPTVDKTDSFTINLYAVDLKNLQYSFTSTPSNSVTVNTAVTTSVTVRDQKSNFVQGLTVQFLRSGPNDTAGNAQTGGSTGGSFSVFTNAVGRAGTSYSSGTPGTATVTVIVTDSSGNELSRGVQNVTFTAGTPTPTPTPTTPRFTIAKNPIITGGITTLTVTGTAGDKVQVLARSFPATAYHVTIILTLDGTGTAKLPIAYSRNTSLFVRNAKGSAAPQSLVVVSIVSMNVKALGAQGVFYGHVTPAVSGRAIKIYYRLASGMNFSLVASGVTNSTGDYRITHTFRANSKIVAYAVRVTDGYNVGNKSAQKALTLGR